MSIHVGADVHRSPWQMSCKLAHGVVINDIGAVVRPLIAYLCCKQRLDRACCIRRSGPKAGHHNSTSFGRCSVCIRISIYLEQYKGTCGDRWLVEDRPQWRTLARKRTES